MRTLLSVYSVALGLCIGSFVGVVVSRLPHLQSVVRPRSRCDACGTPLRWVHNVPLVSFLWLRGRCAHCRQAIGLRALWVELACGGLYLAAFHCFGVGLPLVQWWGLIGALIAICLLDLDYWWVPDQITLPAGVWAAAFALLPGGIGWRQALGGLLPAAILWAFASGYARLTGKEGMGLGDIKLLVVLGLALGPLQTLGLLTLAAMQGAIVGSLVLWTGGHKDATVRQGDRPLPAALADDPWQPAPGAVPFGPFLVLAAFEVVLVPGVFADLHLRVGGYLAGFLV